MSASSRVFVTRRASEDLEDIWLHIATDNITAADQWLERLWQKARALAENPQMGRARPELAADLRSFPVRAYMLYYRPVDNGVELIRAVHVARDIGGLTGLSESEN